MMDILLSILFGVIIICGILIILSITLWFIVNALHDICESILNNHYIKYSARNFLKYIENNSQEVFIAFDLDQRKYIIKQLHELYMYDEEKWRGKCK